MRPGAVLRAGLILAAVGAAWSGMPSAASAAGTLVVPPSHTHDTRSLRSYLHDVSPVDPRIVPGNGSEVTEHYRIPAADGTILDTWIVRPNFPGKRGLVMEFTPYYGGGSPSLPQDETGLDGTEVELLHRGFAVGISSLRGTGNSGGCFSMGAPNEVKDTAAVIEYLAKQPWSNGKVGMTGVSYPGTTPQEEWEYAPPALKTVVPGEGITDMYQYDFENGVPMGAQSTNGGPGFPVYYWAIVGLGPAGLNGGAQVLDPVSMPGTITGEACQQRISWTEDPATNWIFGDKDSFWQQRDFLSRLRADPTRKRPSMLYLQGFQDWNVKTNNMADWVPAVESSGVPFHALLGQWDHNWPQRADWNDFMTAWFDQFLLGRNTGVLNAPRIQMADNTGQWRNESVWPEPAVNVVVHPGQSGAMGPAKGTGSASFNDYAGAPITAEGQPKPNDRVLFTTDPLSNDLHLSGMVRFVGAVTASAARANLMLSLGDEAPDGTITWINWACQNLNTVSNPEAGRTSVAGLRQTVAVNFFPQEDVIKAGDRVVLAAAGNLILPASWQALSTEATNTFTMDPVATGGTVALDLSSASLTLPQDTTLNYESPQPDGSTPTSSQSASSRQRLQRRRLRKPAG